MKKLSPAIPRLLLLSAVLCCHPGGAFSRAMAETASTAGTGDKARDRAAPYDVRRFGAAGDGQTNDSKAIQAAIDRCAQEGGGCVVLKRGRFLSGRLLLRSHVHLQVDAGAVLMGIADMAEYPLNPLPPSAKGAAGAEDPPPAGALAPSPEWPGRALIYAGGCDDVGLCGQGAIDGNGGAAAFRLPIDRPGGPQLLTFVGCTNVTVEDLSLRNAAGSMQSYIDCRHVRIEGLRVHNHSNWNNDGMEIQSTDASVSGCDIDCDDDAILLVCRGSGVCRDVAISHCILATNSCGIEIRGQDAGELKNLAVSRCVIHQASEFDPVRHPHAVNCGIEINAMDQSAVDQVVISGICMTEVQSPFVIKRDKRFGRPDGRPGGVLRNVVVADMTAAGNSRMSSSITGLPGREVEDVTLHDVLLSAPGGGAAEEGGGAARPGEAAPTFVIYRPAAPASGIYIGHAGNVSLRNVVCRVSDPDPRPALVCDEVSGLDVSCFLAGAPREGPLVLLRQTAHALLHGCRLRDPVKTWVQVEGDKSSDIMLTGNDLSRAGAILTLAGGAGRDAVGTTGNVSGAAPAPPGRAGDPGPAPADRGNRVAFRKVPPDGIEVELASERPFPAIDSVPVLEIGSCSSSQSRYAPGGTMRTLIFRLSEKDFAAAKEGDPITVRYEPPSQTPWNFGSLEKSAVR